MHQVTEKCRKEKLPRTAFRKSDGDFFGAEVFA
jgi:hypothetical protein